MSEICEQVISTSIHGALSADIENTQRWFAAYTTPRHEKHVAQLLAERQIESFLPLYRATKQWQKSRPIILDLPLFPMYVFVRIAKQARGSVLGTPGVLSIVGSPREAWPLPDLEIESLRSGILERKIGPHPYLNIGERVRIKTGMMAGVQGVLVRKKNEFRVVITLDAIMRSVAVEVGAEDVEPVTAPIA